nr:DUF445 family protein [Piscibacillus salipiscarius]
MIGALIGGMTNFLAIKMLFRPYEAVYIGKFKLPFTPGLIPKRRNELAGQLGRVVTDYLVTSDALEQKVLEPDFQGKMAGMINQQVDRVVNEGYSIHDLILKVNPEFSIGNLNANMERSIQRKLNDLYTEHQYLKVREILPNDLNENLESKLPDFTNYLIVKIELFLTSEEGQRKISESASNFLKTQGFLGNMVSSYLGEEGLSDKVTPAVRMFLNSDETKESIEELLRKEWEQFKEKDLKEVRDMFGEIQIKERFASLVTKEINIEFYLNQPVNELFDNYLSKLKTTWIPKMIEVSFEALSTNMTSLLEQLNLFDLVKQEVEKFDVSRIEQLVLEITKREMNMITYLGALLGGLIGLLQGLIVMFLT